MSKDFIKKLLREHLKRIIIKPEDGDDYSLDESFDKPLKNIEKDGDFKYIVYEDDIKAEIEFRIEFKNDDDEFKDFSIINPKMIDKYFSLNWKFIDNTEPTPKNWVSVTSTLFEVLNDFIKTIKPTLINFSSRKKTYKVYYKDDFIKKLNSLFPDYYTKSYQEQDNVFMIRKDCSNLREGTIKKSMEFGDFNSLHECIEYYLYNHKHKQLHKGSAKNDIRKEQIKRIINKLRYLY